MRVCGVCQKRRRDSSFSVYRLPTRTYLARTCKSCKRAEKRAVYHSNLSASREKARERWRQSSGYYKKTRRATIEERVAFIDEIKRKTPCADCEEKYDPVVMDFDHVRGKKKSGVAYMAHHGYSLDAIKEEIAKCELVCANCHRLRTWVSKSSGHLKAAA